jgi:hypothetical protein
MERIKARMERMNGTDEDERQGHGGWAMGMMDDWRFPALFFSNSASVFILAILAFILSILLSSAPSHAH